MVVVASAGNGGELGDHISYPAAYPGVIAATAVDRYAPAPPSPPAAGTPRSAPPGVDVIIADPDHRYYEGWGTSAASAFVSGAAALVKAAHPDLTPPRSSPSWRTPPATPRPGAGTTPGASASSTRPPPSRRPDG